VTVPPIAKFNAGYFLEDNEDSTGAPRWNLCIQWASWEFTVGGLRCPLLGGLRIVPVGQGLQGAWNHRYSPDYREPHTHSSEMKGPGGARKSLASVRVGAPLRLYVNAVTPRGFISGAWDHCRLARRL